MSVFADRAETFGERENDITVSLSNELVTLLSDQLYQTPVKAIEELVVNSYDADARICRLFVPLPSDKKASFIAVYDNGSGMDYEALVNLWHVGRSNKREEEIEKRSNRKQIGRFGIGKLATYTVANSLTYVTFKNALAHIVSLDFRRFASSTTGANSAVGLHVRKISDLNSLMEDPNFDLVCSNLGVEKARLADGSTPSWTIAILEDLKPKAAKLTHGKLMWVLGTAMPLKFDFKLYLNNLEIESSKASIKTLVNFKVSDLPEKRLTALKASTGEAWTITKGQLTSGLFPNGISGEIIVTEESLFGKSDDLGRSHGFFVRVRGRLINESLADFGISEKSSYETFFRFRADIIADDLDSKITAPREGVEDSPQTDAFKALLSSIYNEARTRYESALAKNDQADKRKKEEDRNFINPRLVERPIADILSDPSNSKKGGEADGSWFYLKLDVNSDPAATAKSLYSVQSDVLRKYKYEFIGSGRANRMVIFDPPSATFTINEDHDLVRAFPDGLSRKLLEDLVTAEALLEVYLKEYQVPPRMVGEILEKRDLLWRSLAKDHPYSLKLISSYLQDAASDERELEIALVACARAFGFVAKQISGAGEPDGLAVFTDYPGGETTITLEAKSSDEVPSLSAIDFAGLKEHVNRHSANGCLLVAPAYPGKTKEDSAAAHRANDLRISCWTVDQLAKVVASAESRQITARQIRDIVLTKFSPDDVTNAVERLFAEPNWETSKLYVSILDALKSLEARLPDTHRTFDLVAGEVSRLPEFRGIRKEQVGEAVMQLAFASQGGISLNGERIIIHLSHDELVRRLAGLTKESGEPLRSGNFKGTE